MSQPVRELALAYTDAHEETLPRITGRYRFTDREVKAYVFPQTWPTTAHGLRHPGESVPTEVYTIVILATIEYAAAIYFAGSLAYGVNLKDKQVLNHFLAALRAREMPSSVEAQQRYGGSFVMPRPVRRPRGATK
jgi:hypothetical protein